MEDTEDLLQPSVLSIKKAIQNFLEQRLEPKLKEEKKEEGRQKLRDAHEPEAWLDSAARRAGQIQQATHAIKYSHPDAKGTSLNSNGNPLAGDVVVGSHTIAESLQRDVVGNAAALDVYKFLSIDVGGKTLLSFAVKKNPAFKAALSDDPEKAESWMREFANIAEDKEGQRSHKLAKQLYWPLDDGGYHLLAPLFPTSLFHEVWQTIQDDRSSDEAKAARKAKWENAPHNHGHRDYPDLLVQKHGGSKKQNISQFNIDRDGECYLLASCPPNWVTDPVKPPLRVRSVFDGPLGPFGRRNRVRHLTRALRDFLAGVQDYNNLGIRQKRAELSGFIRDELLLFAEEIQNLSSGWSAGVDCQLNPDEQCWLDPGRARDDPAFSETRLKGDWKDGVCKRFGNWLNARLTGKKLPMGENEARAWQSLLDDELRMLRLEVDIDD
ncbi:MAG: type I-F CRISPR-associated protein Csy1 [Proteobacteria bacterium]|nr:type I-F CRISPR-associated protein Csy1 [Pseudomonadota bacterium]